ncbi:type II pantothenate kinase [Anaerobacillus sp. 1_MG-2023]|uniref:type II pantothenate kinase n=1 Tax=Bacillales TaxID=1385 RepID=UPI0026E15B48|nr:type II pantothenate kinase [Anaerobacillus sp. 1_MG-2023]MDO6654967.1 type II pantothenate kinase [Anaerobacillus sp. 1_MG-2023]
MANKIGIDAGGTLIKTVHLKNEKYCYQTFATSDINDVASWVKNHGEAKLMITGGKQMALAKLVENDVEMVPEFEATTSGIRALVDRAKLPLPDNYLVVNVGTGTSIHSVNGQSAERLGGTGVGGGMLMGLAYLLTGRTDFQEITRLAEKGDRNGIDLKVKDIYGEASPIGGDLTASNFGFIDRIKKQEVKDEDVLACLIGMISESILMMAIPFAKTISTSNIVFIGSTFQSNPLIREQLERYEELFDIKAYFPHRGQFSGAVGALLYR